MTTLKLKTGPTVEPLTRDEAKQHCRIDITEDDLYLDNLIVMAREYVEQYCGPLINQDWYQYESDFPAGDSIALGKPRIQTANFSLTYTDVDNVTTTLAAADYTINDENEYFPAVTLNYGYSWPTVTLHTVNPIKITFTCGYGATAAAIPMSLKHAMLLLIGHWYDERQPIIVATTGNSVNIVPLTIDALMANYRYW